MIYFLNDWLIVTTLFVSRHWVAVVTMTAKSVWPIKSSAYFTRSATLWALLTQGEFSSNKQCSARLRLQKNVTIINQ